MDLDTFIARWAASGGAERANYGPFLSELCRVLGVPEPEPTRTDDADNAYVLERTVYEVHDDSAPTPRRIDLYRRGSFVLEAKQGVEKEAAEEEEVRVRVSKGKKTKKGHGTRGTAGWDTFMRRARTQAEGYVRLLPKEEGRPPFVLVVDVGHVIEVYAEFTRSGGAYLPFPAAGPHRITLEDLRREDIRERLRAIWLDPLSLDPSLHAAQVTRKVAVTLAQISRSMEGQSDGDGKALTPERVSAFLMRMIFTMFAEDVGLIGGFKFRTALQDMRADPDAFVPTVDELWRNMATGGYSVALREKIKHFNGGLFENVEVLPVTAAQLELFIAAAEHDWSQVEPSIFGTLVERALDPTERHKLGAHYTPRPYVERLVNHVVLTPLREDWGGVQIEVQAALDQAKDPEKARVKARGLVEAFLSKLLQQRVLDPACGTGNFLYVSMELIKRLEAEVIETLVALGGTPPLTDVSPEQFLGLELNPRAARVAELVLWIGYLQLYARSHGGAGPAEPILKAYRNIRQTDAVLTYSSRKPHVDKAGVPVTRWDGVTLIKDPVTGREVPDPAARVQDTVYVKPGKPLWPAADFIVGNPPFLGKGEAMRAALGDGYVQALRSTYKPRKDAVGVPDSADFVMFWWHKAAVQMASLRRLRRFGFVTTNSIKQTFNRRVIEDHLAASAKDAHPLSLVYAVPDHPWVDEADGAAVRIAMTVVARGKHDGLLERVVDEQAGENGEYAVTTTALVGRINADLTVGADVTAAEALQAFNGLSSNGVMLAGSGFIVTREQAAELGLGRVPGLEAHIREYRNGRDLASRPRGVMVIDLYGLEEEAVRSKFPEVYQHIKLNVWPERSESRDAGFRGKWWLHGRPRSEFRPALVGLDRYVATVETSKHRFFQFLDTSILPDHKLIAIALDDAYTLGVLSSRIHTTWALAQGSRIGVGNDPVYVKSRCFATFPFPVPTPAQQQAIREKAEALDALRKARLAAHAHLTMTDLYNVLEKLRGGVELTDLERRTLQDGTVTVLREYHDELDALVQAAYGWEGQLTDQDILARLTDLNAARAQEERAGTIRYLRPDYQDPRGTAVGDLGMDVQAPAAAALAKPSYPERLAEQSAAVRQVLVLAERALSAEQVASAFSGVRAGTVDELLELLVKLGQVRQVGTDTVAYAA
ncbi:class I SAM-dependent DNA methyltransferase [Deinococcus xianganensis]|uniref:site-specific DNA-methyltransferase (adenine-specific) n=1 Tax=Deinococcus xianganensis TaxID=1507289 RepID=A0A6I4YPK0_9DEIO|nr:class I SAM-dependent DNA methyltransferase [Deinococcus xianganensis]MXV21804.1 class I SAM-dependent DNA methyltransferase [Deinococcus xianganensis]